MNKNSDLGRVLVTGATGDVGGQVLRGLLEAGVDVRAMHREPGQAGDLADLGAEPVLASYGDVESLDRALAGCDAAFLVSPPVAGQARLETQAIDAAVRAGVRRVVRVSAADSNLRSAVPWARAHAEVDRHLASTDLDWTVLRAVAFMSNFAMQAPAIRRGFLPQTTGDSVLTFVDTADVADVAVRTLLEDGHTLATYFLTGSQELSMRDVAQRLTDATGRRVSYVNLPPRLFTLLLRLSGTSPFFARGLRAQFAGRVRADCDVDITHDVRRVLGRPPATVEDWIARNRELFA